MKKILFVLLFSLILSGCSNHSDKRKEQVEFTKSYVEENFSNATILSQKGEEDYYLALVESEDTISLIIFKDVDGKIKYFGGASYDINKHKHGLYLFKQDTSLVVVFSKNDDFALKDLEITYQNINKEEEQLTIKDEIKESNFIKVYTLPNKYDFNSIKVNES